MPSSQSSRSKHGNWSEEDVHKADEKNEFDFAFQLWQRELMSNPFNQRTGEQ